MDINEKVSELFKDKRAVLVDVRTNDEYNLGHIPGSINVPIDNPKDIKGILNDREKNIYLYCQNGERGNEAELKLRSLGYKHIENIGGICNYHGKLE